MNDKLKLSNQYNIGDIFINVRIGNKKIAKEINFLLEALGFAFANNTSTEFEVNVDFISNFKKIKRFESEPIYSSGSIKIYQNGSNLYLTDDKSCFGIDTVKKAGFVIFHDSFWEKQFYSKASWLIMWFILLFWQFDIHELHGAALVKNGKGLMIIGPSGSGKSTIALSLISNGWSFLTDDMILLYKNGKKVKALPLRRYFKIDREVVKKYPELSDIAKSPLGTLENKAFLNLDKVYENQLSNHCIPKIILFPDITRQERSYLKPVKKSEAFINLLTNNCYGMFIENRVIKNRVDTMNALLSQTDGYKLLMGLDLYNDPSMINEILPNF